MEDNNINKPDYQAERDDSIFDRHKHKNQEKRERLFRTIRMVLIGIGFIVLGYVIYRGVIVGARVAAGLVEDLEAETPTATFDLSSLDVASPTPPPTATFLYGGSTYEHELEEVDPDDPDATPRAGAIFFDTPTPILPTATNTPLPTAEFGNFNRDTDAPVLGYAKDPRCADREPHSEYVYCMLSLADGPIEP